LVNDARTQLRAEKVLIPAGVDLDRIDFIHIATDRVWTRDYGPIFITSAKGAVALTDWKFNAWAKYPNWQRDNAVPVQIRKLLKLRMWQPRLGRSRVVLEGGSIDVDGQGLLLTTEECLLSPVQARNPHLARADLERVFADYLGVKKVLWLGDGIAGDDTHGHIDDLARFVAPSTLVAVREDDPADANFEHLQRNWERLQGMTDAKGKPLRLIALPMPRPLYFRGTRLPASYANFYIANDRVLVPTFNDPRDRDALNIVAALFPGRLVVGIHAVDLVWGFGTLHCLTQQQPCTPTNALSRQAPSQS
jgi:agmatine deiminase